MDDYFLILFDISFQISEHIVRSSFTLKEMKAISSFILLPFLINVK